MLTCTRLLFLMAALLGHAALAQAQANKADDYPNRPMRFIIPYPPGGTPAQFAAFIAAETKKFAQIVKVSGAKLD